MQHRRGTIYKSLKTSYTLFYLHRTVGEYDKIICNAYQLYGIEGILMYLEQNVPLSVFIEFSFVHKGCGGLFIEHRERIKF